MDPSCFCIHHFVCCIFYLWVNRETIRNHAYIPAETEEMDWSMSCRENVPFCQRNIRFFMLNKEKVTCSDRVKTSGDKHMLASRCSSCMISK